MQRFTTKIVDLMKQENLFASQGGPIIFSQVQFSRSTWLIYITFAILCKKYRETENNTIMQIENEYGNGDIEPQYGARAKAYVDWAAGMAISLNTGVPWIMCQQKDAPDPIVS